MSIKLYQVRQKLNKDKLIDIEKSVWNELYNKGLASQIKPGQKIAVTVGSRGIANLAEIVRAVVRWLQECGARPFIIPAMGSHGDADAGEQKKILEDYGVTESFIGAPIISCMDVVQLGTTSEGAPVYIDKMALQSDGIVALNRIKPHTTMSGPVQSGLLKVLAVGLGKHQGAQTMHYYGLEKTIPEAARVIFEKVPVMFGVAIIENSYEEICQVVAIRSEDIESTEKQLLVIAEKNLPSVPFDPLDALIVRYMGKNISGSGMDTNIVGRWRRVGGKQDKQINRIGVFDLTEESHGNAIGVGMADFITEKLYKKINLKAMYTNALTAGWVNGVKIPIIMKDEQQIFAQLLSRQDNKKFRMVIIESTLALETFYISEGLLNEAKMNALLELVDTCTVDFTKDGELVISSRGVKSDDC